MMISSLALVAMLASAAPAAGTPRQQPRDTTAPRPAAAEGGRISGVVIGADAARAPIRRARVALTGAAGSRVEITDDRGAFAFDRLQAGSYTISVSKAAYLPALYGAPQPGRAGTSIVLADKQSVEISVSLTRGAVVTGTVRDARGRAMSGIDVGVVPLPTPAQPKPSMTARPVQTDDRGEYRLYGVPPGSYYVAAVPLNTFSGGVAGLRSVQETDAIFAALQQRAREIPSEPVAGAPEKTVEPLPLGPPTAFAPMIFPGVTRVDSATVVTLGAGEERNGIDFVMTSVRVGAIEGTISGGVRNLDRVELSLMFEGPQFPTSSSNRPVLSLAPDKQGRFRYDNILPGKFSITARALAGEGDPLAAVPIVGSGFASGPGSSVGRRTTPGPGGDDFIYGRVEVDVDTGVAATSIVLSSGATLSGSAVFDAAGASVPDLTAIRVRLDPIENTSVSVSSNTMIGNPFQFGPATPFTADAKWQVRGVPPGRFVVTPALPASPAGWWLRSAVVNGRDLLDGPIDLQPGQLVPDIVFTFSDRHSELSGTLTTSAGKAASDYFIIVCPVDASLWMRGSRRVKSLRPGSDGTFSVKDLPAGDYVIVALTDVAPGDWNDPRWLASIAPAGAPITIADGKKTVQDLRIGGGQPY
jgi:hypothetical protein